MQFTYKHWSEADWQLIKNHKQDLINKGNKYKNYNGSENTYRTGDKVLLIYAWKTKYNQDAYLGPYTITSVNKDNDTATTHRDKLMDVYNIYNITPYKE